VISVSDLSKTRWLPLVGLLLLATPCQGEELDAVEKSAARDLAVQAADAFDAGNYELALEHFTRAQQLFPAPTLSFMQARCLHRLGRWVEAFEIFTETARTELAPDAPEAYLRAVADARVEADDLHARLPRIEIKVPETPGLTVTVDDRLLPPALHDVTHPINPGTHRVRAMIDDEGYFEQTVVIAERDFKLIAIPRPREEVAPGVLQDPVDGGFEPAPVRHSSTPSWVVPTAFALGGVGSAAAVVSLILGSGVKKELDRACIPRDECPPAMDDELQSYRLYRALFITGAAVGVVGIGTGVYFVLSDSSDGGVAVAVTPNGARVSGSF
jgi:hypothetical protein